MNILGFNIITEKRLQTLLSDTSGLTTPSVTCPKCRTIFMRKPSVVEKLAGMAGHINVKELLYLYRHFCAKCEVKFKDISEATIDHIQPKSKGGKNGLHNYQLMCAKCNLRKGNKWNPYRTSPTVKLEHLLDAKEKMKLMGFESPSQAKE